jgi:hypothetical protein
VGEKRGNVIDNPMILGARAGGDEWSMRMSSTDENLPGTPSVTLTMSPQLALDIATAMLRGELAEAAPLAEVVNIGVALCDVIYESDHPLGAAVRGAWTLESSDSTGSASGGEAEDTLEADLHELAQFRRDQRSKAVELISAVLRLEEPLEVFVDVLRDDVAVPPTIPADPPAELAAYLHAQDSAFAQTSAVVAEAVEITKGAVNAAAEARAAAADTVSGSSPTPTAMAAEELAAVASRTAAEVQSQADASATIAAGAASDAAARVALTVMAAAEAAAAETAMAALTVSHAVEDAATAAAAMVRRGASPIATALAAQVVADTAAQTALTVQLKAEAAASLAANAASDAAVRVANVVAAEVRARETETVLAALAVSRAVAVAVTEAATLAAEAAVTLELEVRNAALAVQAIASATAAQAAADADVRGALVALQLDNRIHP